MSVRELLNVIRTGADDRVKVAAIHQLEGRQDSSIVTALIAALQDESVPVRNAAVAALRGTDDPRAIDALWNAARDPSQTRDFRMSAAAALAHLHDARSADLLIDALPYTPSRASASLIELGTPAVRPLINALDRAEVREAASRVLVSIGGAAVDPLIELLHSNYNKYARLAAARTLAEIDDPRAARALTEALKVPNTEFTAAVYRFLIRQGQPGTEVQMIAALKAYGNPAMAEDFGSSGNATLKAASENWARDSGFVPAARTSELPPVQWASVHPNR